MKYTKQDGWLVDDNNNRVDLDKYTEEVAIKILDSLEDCIYCEDCEDCIAYEYCKENK